MRRNSRLKHVIEARIEGKTEGTGRRERRRKQLLDDLKKARRYWKLRAEALARCRGQLVLEEAIDLSSDRLRDNADAFCTSQRTHSMALHRPSCNAFYGHNWRSLRESYEAQVNAAFLDITSRT